MTKVVIEIPTEAEINEAIAKALEAVNEQIAKAIASHIQTDSGLLPTVYQDKPGTAPNAERIEIRGHCTQVVLPEERHAQWFFNATDSTVIIKAKEGILGHIRGFGLPVNESVFFVRSPMKKWRVG